MTTINLIVSGMTCGACVKHVEKAIQSIAGVSLVDVDLTSGLVKVEGDVSQSIPAIIAALEEEGYPAKVNVEGSGKTKVKRESCKNGKGCCCN
jgi:copper chaperone CopZ